MRTFFNQARFRPNQLGPTWAYLRGRLASAHQRVPRYRNFIILYLYQFADQFSRIYLIELKGGGGSAIQIYGNNTILGTLDFNT